MKLFALGGFLLAAVARAQVSTCKLYTMMGSSPDNPGMSVINVAEAFDVGSVEESSLG